MCTDHDNQVTITGGDEETLTTATWMVEFLSFAHTTSVGCHMYACWEHVHSLKCVFNEKDRLRMNFVIVCIV